MAVPGEVPTSAPRAEGPVFETVGPPRTEYDAAAPRTTVEVATVAPAGPFNTLEKTIAQRVIATADSDRRCRRG